MSKVNLTHKVEIELQGNGQGWTDITKDVVLDSPLNVTYGINSHDVRTRLGRIGTMSFYLDNSNTNVAGLKGQYSPDHANALTGFQEGAHVRWTVQKERSTDNDAAYGADVTWSTDVPSIDNINSRALFGTDSMNISDSNIDNIFSNAGTVSTWLRTSSDTWDNSSDTFTPFYLAGDNGDTLVFGIDAGVMTGTMYRDTDTTFVTLSDSDFTSTDCFHAILAWDSDSFDMYLNGTKSTSSDEALFSTGATITIEINSGDWNNIIGEFAIYGTKLDSDQVAELYGSRYTQETAVRTLIDESTLDSDKSGLLKYYPMKEGTGLVAEEYSTDIWYKFFGTIDEITPEVGDYRGQKTKIVAVDWFYEASEIKIAGIPAQVGLRIDEIIANYLANDAVKTQPNETKFHQGTSIFSYAGTAGSSKTALSAEIRRLVESEPSYAYMRGSKNTEGLSGGVFVVENATVRGTRQPEVAITTQAQDIKVSRKRNKIYNDIRTTVHPSVIDTDIIRIFELQEPVTCGANATTVFTGSYKDSDDETKKIGAYDVSPVSDADYTIAYAGDPLGDRIVTFGTDIEFYWTLQDLTGAEYFDTDLSLNIVGTPVVTSDGPGGMNYLYLNSTNDNAQSTNAVVNFSLEKGTVMIYALQNNLPVATSNITSSNPYNADFTFWGSSNVTAQSFWGFEMGRANPELGTNVWSSDMLGHYYVSLGFGEEWGVGDSDYSGWLASKVCGLDSDYEDNPTFTQYAYTWDFKWGSTDTVEAAIFVDGALVTDLAGGGSGHDPVETVVPKKGFTSDYVWTIRDDVWVGLFERWLTNYGVSNLAVFNRALVSSDLLYIDGNTTDNPTTDNTSVSVIAGGTSPEITVINETSSPVLLTEMSLYGRTLTDLNPLTVKKSDSDSINDYGVSVYELDMPYQDEVNLAANAATELLSTLKDPKTNVTKTTFLANLDSNTITGFLDVEPGDIVLVTEDITGAGDYEFVVQGVKYRIEDNDIVEVEWTTYTGEQTTAWLLGISGLSNIGDDTYV